MKLYIIITFFLSLVCFCSPLIVLSPIQEPEKENKVTSISTTVKEEQIEKTENSLNDNEKTVNEIKKIKILRVSTGKVIEREMFEYLKGAVASEMPISFEAEALKAQAVACYSYALWLIKNCDNGSLSGADLSDSASKYQGYLDDDELKEKWGTDFDKNIKKITDCINEVGGIYLEYEGEPIMACYHGISPGRTESAKTAWGTDIPYLQSVPANGDLLSPQIESTIVLTDKQFKEKCEKLNGVELSKNSDTWLTDIKQSETGFVTNAVISGKAFDGNDLRSAFSLRSPFFTVEHSQNKFCFNVKGYGHGVGMSQNSADYMARQGSSYKEILLHFYKNAELVNSN